LIGEVNKLTNYIKIVSLLQPPPETFALFDELILMSEGQVIFSGPMDEVVPHFLSLGYELPERMDVADWLQALPTKDGKEFLTQSDGVEPREHLASEEFCNKFYETRLGKEIISMVQETHDGSEGEDNPKHQEWMQAKYRNTAMASLNLVVRREMLLWWRDQSQIRARLAQDLVMGIIAGTIFWQANDDPTSIMGILFQSMFFVSVGAMLKVPGQYEHRSILYKQQDSNFFPTWTYVVGKSLASIPASVIDGVVYGSLIFWFVGLAHDDGASFGNYVMFMLLVLMGSVSIGLLFSIFPAITPDRSTGQGIVSTVSIVLLSW
jgi:ABC-2 type transporter